MPTQKIPSPFPDQFSDRQWARYVRQGRDLVEEESQIQFKLGDISLKMVASGARDSGVFRVMDRYADLIGINVHTLLGYRHVAHAWPKQHRQPGVSWSIHRALDALEDRFEVIQNPPGGADRWTEDMALRHAGRLPHRQLTKGEKLDRVRVLLRQEENAVDAVGELIRRPDVAAKVMDNPANKRILYRAHQEQRQQAEQARWQAAYTRVDEEEPAAEDEGILEDAVEEEPATQDALQQREPAVDYTRASREVLELLGMGTSFLVELQHAIPDLHVAEFTEREVRAILDNHRRIRAALDWCDTVVTTGDKTMDEELARILDEGDELP
ncbi:DUF6192 family protein [Streptomyces sp. JJ38]|uniref:DUF6192 family protein n=1 Tax=Streptomyces sp. JJ38 TaxID=2738128 RepID=UPI001C5630F1|nr:DUF6192 family protein [Streptomyces sp. JJ38]MBW1597250.1 hypothetical protein [Streptomyces sp. JJ38]